MNIEWEDCIEWEESIAQYAGGDLESAASSALELHLEACCACTALADALARDREWLRSRPPELDDAGYETMRLALRRQIVRRRRVNRFASVLVAAASMAAAVTVATRVASIPVASPRVTAESGSPHAQTHSQPVPPPGLTADLAMLRPGFPKVRSAHRRVAVSPSLDPFDVQAIKAAWEELNGTGGSRIAEGSTSPIEMRIATRDPDVVIIWLQPTQEGSDD